MKDFFISYNKADREWAGWIAWQLEEAGYTTVLEEWDFRPGFNFVLEMQGAASEAERTISVLSSVFLNALYTQPEWAAAFAQDPTGEKGKLVPVRVRECRPKGLLKSIIYIDLVDLSEEDAKEKLITGVLLGRKKPKVKPFYPKAERPRFPGALPPVWNVPNRNPNFTGRENLLAELHTALTSGEPAALTQAISGLGGVGKTQLAIEYAYRHAGEYKIVWWVKSEEPAALAEDYASLAGGLGISIRSEPNQNIFINAVKRELEQTAGWLLVFDNARDQAEVRKYIPQGTAGHIIITSRNPVWRGTAQSLSVKIMKRAESVGFLLKRTGQTDKAAAGVLADVLGDLPLALEQAGAYIEATGIAISEYYGLFRERSRELLERGIPSTDYEFTVATTWNIAFQEVRKESTAGTCILNLCAYLAPDNIPKDIIQKGTEFLPAPLAGAVKDKIKFNDAVTALRRYSLITISGETISVHRLVQAVVSDRLSDKEKKTWAGAAVQIVKNAFPEKSRDVHKWSECVRLLPHAVTSVEHAKALDIEMESAGWLLNQAGLYLYWRAAYIEAEPLLRRALEILEKALGPDHLNTATSINNLALLYKSQGKYTEAGILYERAFEIYEKSLGPDHPYTATPLNNIAELYRYQGKYSEAEPLFKRALNIMEKTLGPDHPDTATSMNNLAILYGAQGRYPEAEPLYKRALEITEKSFGPDHPSTATSLNNLALLYEAQGKYPEAEPLCKRALEITEKALGPKHPNTAAHLNNLAELYSAQGKYIEAEPLFKRAMEIAEKSLGPNHPSTATCLNNLAGLYESQGKYTQAEPLYKRSLEILEKILGEEHPNTITVMKNLAGFYDEAGSKKEAKKLLERIKKIQSKTR